MLTVPRKFQDSRVTKYLPADLSVSRESYVFCSTRSRLSVFDGTANNGYTFKRSKTVISLVIRSFQEVNIPVCVVSAETKFSANFYRNPCCVRVFFFNKKGW